jgi:hypothetical protein
MRKTLIVAAISMFALVGCKSDKHDDMSTSGDPKKMSTKDDCNHCAGNQTARADGTCPACGMKVKS